MQEKGLTLGMILQILTEKRGVSLNAISASTGLSKSYLSRIKNSERTNPTLDTLEKISEYFDMEVSDLLKSEVVIVADNEEEEQEDKQEIEVDILFKEELDQVCRELWQEIQIYCNKEKVTVENIKPILRKIHDLRLLNKKLS
jgi:transcriptional regulator with XRE-family HTH domain